MANLTVGHFFIKIGPSLRGGEVGGGVVRENVLRKKIQISDARIMRPFRPCASQERVHLKPRGRNNVPAKVESESSLNG